jgi:hypothetical protein
MSIYSLAITCEADGATSLDAGQEAALLAAVAAALPGNPWLRAATTILLFT